MVVEPRLTKPIPCGETSLSLSSSNTGLAVHIVVCGGFSYVRDCIESVLRHTPPPFQLRIWDNNSDRTTLTLLEAISAAWPTVTVYWSPRNFGFGWPHNSMACDATEPYICFLNSDAVVGPGWADSAIELLATDPEVGAVGAVGCDYHGTRYVEGSCLFMRRDQAKKFGPFDVQAFPLAYCEDADLSARLTQAGYRLAVVPVAGWKHQAPGATARRVTEEQGLDVTGQMVRNRQTFIRRWPRPARPTRVVIRREGAVGDLLCTVPAIEAFAKQQPDIRIQIETFVPEVFYRNPYVDRAINPASCDPQRVDFDLDGVVEKANYPSLFAASESIPHAVDLFAEALGVKLSDDTRSPNLYLAPYERQWASDNLPFDYMVFVTNTGWSIKEWPYWSQLTQATRQRWPDLRIVWLGTQKWATLPHQDNVIDLRGATKLRQAFAVLANARLVISADTGLLHAAAALRRPTIGLFGPVNGDLRAHSGQSYIQTPLSCQGCYHRLHAAMPFQEDACFRLNLHQLAYGREFAPCMEALAVDRVLAAVEKIAW